MSVVSRDWGARECAALVALMDRVSSYDGIRECVLPYAEALRDAARAAERARWEEAVAAELGDSYLVPVIVEAATRRPT